MTKTLKEKIFKLARESGCDIDGDTLRVFDKQYYVDYLNDVVEEIKTEVENNETF